MEKLVYEYMRTNSEVTKKYILKLMDKMIGGKK